MYSFNNYVVQMHKNNRKIKYNAELHQRKKKRKISKHLMKTS